MSVLETIKAQAAPFVALRQDLHRHPELGLQEFRTSALLAGQLERWGLSDRAVTNLSLPSFSIATCGAP